MMPVPEPSTRDTRELGLRVTAVHREAEGVVSLRLSSADGQPLPEWEPGAHIDLGMGSGIVRQYSLCSDPGSSQEWRIAVLLEPNGRGGSKFVHESVRRGDVLRARGPRNNFALVDSDRYLFIAGGIGITPIVPMVREVSARGKAWTLLYGGRTHRSMAFVDELREYAGGELHIRPEDEFGLLDLDRFLDSPSSGTTVYSCGPGPLLDAVGQRCPSESLHLERFAPSAAASTGGFEVRLARSGDCLHVPDGTSLLEVLEEAGYEITNSCRAGICGTCVLPVSEGTPDHHDDVLSDAESESNEVMLPCVSRSKTDILVLDL